MSRACRSDSDNMVGVGRGGAARTDERTDHERFASPLLVHSPKLGGMKQDGEGPQTEKAQQSMTFRDENKQGRTAASSFQDRCLKPLGHPSVATASST